MHDYEDHWLDWAQDCYIEDLLKQTGLQQIEGFFFRCADKYQKCINYLIKNSKTISAINQYDMALVSVVSALELLIRFFYLKPLIGGMFLNDDWFDFIYECKIVPDRSKDEKDLLKKLLLKHGINAFDEIIINDKPIWDQLSVIYKIRNGIVHNGNKTGEEEYQVAILCFKELVGALEKVYKSFVILGENTMKLIADGWEM